jgi:hypothetical protein
MVVFDLSNQYTEKRSLRALSIGNDRGIAISDKMFRQQLSAKRKAYTHYFDLPSIVHFQPIPE